MVEITGRSGSGKSTLLNMLAGMLTPTSGKVFLDDTDLYALDEKSLARLRNEKIGLIPQGHTALLSLTVLENVLLPAILYNRQNPPVDRAKALLVDVGLEALMTAKPNELSGGELRRMAIARAMLMRPSILLADEPTAGLDNENTLAVPESCRLNDKNRGHNHEKQDCPAVWRSVPDLFEGGAVHLRRWLRHDSDHRTHLCGTETVDHAR